MKLLPVVGTRVECVKMAPVLAELARCRASYKVVVRAQHREILGPLLKPFSIKVEYGLSIMKTGQDLYRTTNPILAGLKDIFEKEAADVVFV